MCINKGRIVISSNMPHNLVVVRVFEYVIYNDKTGLPNSRKEINKLLHPKHQTLWHITTPLVSKLLSK